MSNDPYADDILTRLHARVEEVCKHLLPGGKPRGTGYFAGDTSGKSGDSLEVELQGPKVGLWHDRSSSESGSLLKLWMMNRGIRFPDALDEAADFLGIPRRERTKSSTPSKRLDPSGFEYAEPTETHLTKPEPMPEPTPENDPMPPETAPKIDWDSCIMDFTEKRADEVCKARGYSAHFVDWLHEQEMIGIYKGCVAFPVHNDKGEVVRIHFKGKDHWQYYPKGGETAALLVGAPIAHAAEVLAFESQWDAFAMLDKLGAHLADNANKYCAYITRGASTNTNLSKLAVPKLIACPQNDPPEKASKTTGRTPAEEWLFRIQGSKHKSTAFSVFDTPPQHKDANDWIRADQPTSDEVIALFSGAKNPLLKSVMSAAELIEIGMTMKDDPDSLIGYERRFLGKGGSMLIIGPSGIGKSTLMTSFLCHAAAGEDWNGIKFRRPLRVLAIQAENDNGDLAEMMTGIFRDPIILNQFREGGGKLLKTNLLFNNLTDKTGAEFVNHLEQMVRGLEIDLVCIDPLLSYVGDDISLQKVASNFLRHNMLPVMKSTGVMVAVVHHTGKPPKEKTKQTNSELSYSGLGSSELVNWARAVCCIVPTDEEGIFEFRITKRGSRAGMIDQFTGSRTDKIHIAHNATGEGIFWRQVQYEAPEPEAKSYGKGGGKGGTSQGKRINTSEYLHLIPKRVSNGELARILREDCGMKQAQILSAIKEMRAEGLIKAMGDGSWEKQN
jgi:hypothetical protein